MTPAQAVAAAHGMLPPSRAENGFLASIAPRTPLQCVALCVSSTILFTSLFCGATALYVLRPSASIQRPTGIERVVGAKPAAPSGRMSAAGASAAARQAPALNSSTITKQPVPKPCYLAPAVVKGTLEGRLVNDYLKINSAERTYTLGERDYLDLILPAAPRPEQTVSLRGTSLISVKHRVDYASLAKLPANQDGEHVLNIKGTVQLTDTITKRPVSGYRINLRFKTEGHASTTAVKHGIEGHASTTAVKHGIEGAYNVASELTIRDSKGAYRLSAPTRTLIEPGYVVQF